MNQTATYGKTGTVYGPGDKVPERLRFPASARQPPTLRGAAGCSAGVERTRTVPCDSERFPLTTIAAELEAERLIRLVPSNESEPDTASVAWTETMVEARVSEPLTVVAEAMIATRVGVSSERRTCCVGGDDITSVGPGAGDTGEGAE